VRIPELYQSGESQPQIITVTLLLRPYWMTLASTTCSALATIMIPSNLSDSVKFSRI
jgi:hypothetical protein